MQELANADPRGHERVQIEFALGAALEQVQQFEASFEHYARGNSLQRATFAYDPAIMTEHVRSSTAQFTAQFFAERAGWGSQQADPIFIVGMPRSGSTLLEQILASHSQIEGTRELVEVPSLALELVARVASPNQNSVLEQIAALRADEAAGLATRYLDRARGHRALGRLRFIDKLPGNWLYLGFIQLLFRARPSSMRVATPWRADFPATSSCSAAARSSATSCASLACSRGTIRTLCSTSTLRYPGAFTACTTSS